jgi:hypothetical protein
MAGSRIDAIWGTEVTPGSNQARETVVLSVSHDVADVRGRVVIPAGSTIHLNIRILPASSLGQADGAFAFSVQSATIRGQTYDMWGYLTSVPHARPVVIDAVVELDAARAAIQAPRRNVAVDAGAPVVVMLTAALTVWMR